MKKTIGIIGGMGPMATADLFAKIVSSTDAACDRDHLRVCIDSNTNIPDRTEAILHGGESPLREMIRSAILLEGMGAQVLIIPCNTAHYFYGELCKMVNVPVLNMIEETAKRVREENISCVGLLATDGTVQSGVYGDMLASYGIKALTPDEEGQRHVMDVIYKGVKAGRDIDIAGFMSAIERLKLLGAKALILGCTELPLAFSMYHINERIIDPTTILARSAVAFAGGRLKEE